jgi:hypothetical protein
VGNLVGTTASITGNVTAGNVIATGVVVNGQPTTYGVVNGSYLKYTRTASQSVSANSVIVCNVSESSSGTAVSVNTSTGQVTLTAGTYRLRGTAGTTVGSAAASFVGYGWYNETTSAWIGEGAQILSPGAGNYNVSTGGTAEAVITVASTTVVSLRVITATNVSSIGGNQSDFSGTYANPWIDIEQLNPTIAVQATATGTVAATVGNVTLVNNYNQTVAATSPGTTIFTLPTLQPGTYLITAMAKYSGGYISMGIFTGGSQVANTSVFNWYQATGSVGLGMQGTWVLTVTTPTVYTINAWGGGTVQTAADGAGVANYIKLDSTFALNTLATISTTGNVSVGGNLNVTGNTTVTGGIRKSARILTTTTTLTVADASGFIEFAGSGTYTVTLPDPTQAANSGIGYRFWQNTVSNITLSTPAGAFYGPSGSSASTKVLAQATTQYWDVWSDGFNWSVFGIKIA